MTDKKANTVYATYNVSEKFIIPAGIDLNNKEQVESWGIKWKVLFIYMVSGEVIEVSSENYAEEYDYKYPDNTELVYEEEE